MACRNSLKIYLENTFSPYRAAASLLARNRSRPSAPANFSPAPLQPTSPRPSPARWLLLPRAAPVAAPRPDRVRTLSPRGDHASASPAARQPRPAHVPTRPPTPAGAGALAHSRPRCLPSPPEPRAPSSAPRRAHAPAGAIRRGSSTSAGNRAPAAPPRPPSSRARACAAFRAQVEPPRALPPTAMAPPCSAAMEVDFLLFSSPA